MLYSHRQWGTVIIVTVTIVLIMIAILYQNLGRNPVGIAVFAILLVTMLLFHSLTVEVDHQELHLIFGIGLFRKRFELKEIREVKPVRNHWYYGWGIRMTPHGWLYNVAGLGAVEITMTNGNKYRIGTDEPEKLNNVLNQTIQQSS